MKCNFEPILIGSFPHTNSKQITSLIIRTLTKYPMWAQLPNKSFKESMYVQYSEGIPFFSINESETHISFSNPENDPETLMEFIESAENKNKNKFAISESFASGLYEFYQNKNNLSSEIEAVKGHITGPFSFALAVPDENKRASWFDLNLRDIIKTGLAMKALWQIEFLKQIYDEVVLFIDEPYLASVGSGMTAIDKNEVKEEIASFITNIKSEYPDITAGVHCCGNTDWSIILDSPADILSYDAYTYGESILSYKEDLMKFIKRGGKIAWGIIPTSQIINGLSEADIISQLTILLKEMEKAGFGKEEIRNFSLISPACGTGSLTESEAEKILLITKKTSQIMQTSV